MRHALHSGLPTSGSCVLLNSRWKWHMSGSLEGETADESYTMKVLCAGNWGRQAPQIWKKMRPGTPEGSGMDPYKASKFLTFGALVTSSVEAAQVEPSHCPEHFWNRVYRDELRPGIPPQGELALRQRALEEWIGSSHTALDTSRLSGLPLTLLPTAYHVSSRGELATLSFRVISLTVCRQKDPYGVLAWPLWGALREPRLWNGNRTGNSFAKDYRKCNADWL